jgi:hypothetical protein
MAFYCNCILICDKILSQIKIYNSLCFYRYIKNLAVYNLISYIPSIPGGVIGDFVRGSPNRTMCPEVDSAPENDYQGFLLG